MPTVEWGGWAWTLNLCSLPPHPRTDEQLRLWPLPHPQFSPSAAACSPLPCFLHRHHWHVCHLLPFCSLAPPFCSAFALCWRGGFSSQLPSCYLLTLRRKVSKLWSRDGQQGFAVLSNFLGWAPGRLAAFLAPIAAYCTPYHLHMGWKGPECDLSCLSPIKSALACIPLSREGDGGATGWLRPRLWAAALHAGTQLLSLPPIPSPLPQLGSAAGERLNYSSEPTAEWGGGPCTA